MGGLIQCPTDEIRQKAGPEDLSLLQANKTVCHPQAASQLKAGSILGYKKNPEMTQRESIDLALKKKVLTLYLL